MKGKHKLYTTVVPSSIATAKKPNQKRNIYIEQRHDLMACRYYYHATICRLRYDDCLLQLSREFNLGAPTIIANLKLRLYAINTMVEQEIAAKELRSRYPWLDWSGKALIPQP